MLFMRAKYCSESPATGTSLAKPSSAPQPNSPTHQTKGQGFSDFEEGKYVVSMGTCDSVGRGRISNQLP